VIDGLLKKVGFSEEEIKKIREVNENLQYVLVSDVLQLLKYLEKIGLKLPEMVAMANKNPWVLTESFERIDYLEKYYKMIGIEGDSYKELLIKYPIAISQNPAEVKQEIERQIENGRTAQEIQEDFFANFGKYFSI